MKKLFLTTCLMLGTLSAHAAGGEDNKQVGVMTVNNNGLVAFQVKNATTSAHPACFFGLLVIKDSRTTPGFPADSAVYQAWYSAVLAAQKSGTTISVSFEQQADTTCRVNYINFN